MDKPTREQIVEAVALLCEPVKQWNKAGRTGLPVLTHYDMEALETLLTATSPEEPTDDPRPTDMAELAKQVAKELRVNRKTWAAARASYGGHVWFVWVARFASRTDGWIRAEEYGYSMSHSDFDNLGPCAIADLIQAEETKRAQEWAGDE